MKRLEHEMSFKRLTVVKIEVVDEETGRIDRSHVVSNFSEYSVLDAIASGLAECLVAMSPARLSDRRFGKLVTYPPQSPVEAEFGERMAILFGMIDKLPLLDSPDWLAIKAIADARSERVAGSRRE